MGQSNWVWIGSCEKYMGVIIGTGWFVFCLQSKDLDCHIELILLLMFYSSAVECRYSGTNAFSQLSCQSDSVEILYARFRKAHEGQNWEAEVTIEDREAVDPLHIRLGRASEVRTDSDVCSAPLE
jgi:hypothetical protein